MINSISSFGQYKEDFFKKLNFKFIPKSSILDLGCGDGTDAKIFQEVYKLKVYATDIYQHPNVKSNNKIIFKKSSIYKIPFSNNKFDYIFLHDVLHHIDEPQQRFEQHTQGLTELKRVCKKNGKIIIAEGNRYNPLFYPHMVLIRGHQHFTYGYFKKLMTKIFIDVEFKHFEAHLYPNIFIKIFKFYERIMEQFIPKYFLAYNIAVINNK